MKQWDKTSGPFNGSEYNECYIENIENNASTGIVLFQKDSNSKKVKLLKYAGSIEDLEGNVYPLPEYYETKNCYWYDNESILDAEVLYEWNYTDEGEILIWWDHDLGDVAVDTFVLGKDDLGVVPAENVDEDDTETICNGVKFIYIT